MLIMRSPSMLLVVVAACGGTGENIDAEACTDLQAATTGDITAGEAMDATAPAVEAPTHALHITLPASGTGYLSFNSTDDTEYALFTDRWIDIKAFTPTGTEVPPQAMSMSSSVCGEIKGRHIIELAVAQFYFKLGPDTAGPFAFVLRPYNPD